MASKLPWIVRLPISGGFIAFALLLYGPTAQGQSSDDRLQLRGVVPERARVSLSRDNTFVPFSGRESGEDDALQVGTDGRMETVIAEIAVSLNSRTGYELRLQTESLRVSDALALQGEGISLPYSLYFGDRKVEFSDGEAILVRSNASGPNSTEINPKPLRLRTEAPFEAPRDDIVVEDRIFLVFRAR